MKPAELQYWDLSKGLGPKDAKAAVDYIRELEADKLTLKTDHDGACKTIADMHAAALGEVTGPKRGVVEDVEDLRLYNQALKDGLDAWQERAEKAEVDREPRLGYATNAQLIDELRARIEMHWDLDYYTTKHSEEEEREETA